MGYDNLKQIYRSLIDKKFSSLGAVLPLQNTEFFNEEPQKVINCWKANVKIKIRKDFELLLYNIFAMKR